MDFMFDILNHFATGNVISEVAQSSMFAAAGFIVTAAGIGGFAFSFGAADKATKAMYQAGMSGVKRVGKIGAGAAKFGAKEAVRNSRPMQAWQEAKREKAFARKGRAQRDYAAASSSDSLLGRALRAYTFGAGDKNLAFAQQGMVRDMRDRSTELGSTIGHMNPSNLKAHLSSIARGGAGTGMDSELNAAGITFRGHGAAASSLAVMNHLAQTGDLNEDIMSYLTDSYSDNDKQGTPKLEQARLSYWSGQVQAAQRAAGANGNPSMLKNTVDISMGPLGTYTASYKSNVGDTLKKVTAESYKGMSGDGVESTARAVMTQAPKATPGTPGFVPGAVTFPVKTVTMKKYNPTTGATESFPLTRFVDDGLHELATAYVQGEVNGTSAAYKDQGAREKLNSLLNANPAFKAQLDQMVTEREPHM
ncbi:MAG TPA: hypothetical protein VLA77_00780 [Candidatus Saccharimonadales bacterium]|nr:hypothetical protein [Candidatus Saccharimonadales bacterium]